MIEVKDKKIKGSLFYCKENYKIYDITNDDKTK